ncbi:MAG: ATP-binding protein [Bacteroidetes bacterium]|jgi:AAA15 family ATPase/GTPase|nr:MAG: ATP-binding protein [Bacteroidota bacterium]
MVILFRLENFRSIKSVQEISLEASGANGRPDNFSEIETKGKPVRVLKSAVVYGPNASGKSNVILGLHALRWLVLNSVQLKLDENIPCYEPFKLDPVTTSLPVRFELQFIHRHIRYEYEIAFTQKAIQTERMTYYPEGRRSLLFEREVSAGGPDRVLVRKSIKKSQIPGLFHNQLFLSRFGSLEPHELFTPLYQFFQELEVWNAADAIRMRQLRQRITEDMLHLPSDAPFFQQLNQLIVSADTGIQAVRVEEAQEDEFRFPDFLPGSLRTEFIRQNRVRTFARHAIYKEGKEAGYTEFDFEEESAGTQVLFGLGGIALEVLHKGGVLIFDELDNSLHPDLVRFLVRLFLNPNSNPHHAQLVFATHEVSLLDKGLFRKDQIWFTQKNRQGETDLYGLADFEGIRDDAPFDRLYMNGKFQALPRVKASVFLHKPASA